MHNIGNFREAIANQTYKNIEFVVVDNVSTDGTLAYLERVEEIQVVQVGPERVHQGNIGMLQIARGDYVGYFDADMYLSPNLVSASVAYLSSHPGVVALSVKEIILGKTISAKSRRFEREFYENTSSYVGHILKVPGNANRKRLTNFPEF